MTMRCSDSLLRAALLCLTSAVFSGCASWPAEDDPHPQQRTAEATSESRALRLVAQDFVHALAQMHDLPAHASTISLLRAALSDDFTRHLQDSLQAAGYAVRWVGTDASREQGEHLMQYRYEAEAADDVSHRGRYDVAVGSIELRRSYLIHRLAGVSPVSPLYIRGTDARHIVLDDARFASAVTAQADTLSAPLTAPFTAPDIAPEAGLSRADEQRLAPRAVPDVPYTADPLRSLLPGTARQPALRLPLVALSQIENVFELGESNYRKLLAGRQVIREQILTFPNDSLRLGEFNKGIIQQMVASYRPDTDLFSVIGCSLGPTRLKSGNAALALGRASRVREALLFAGVTPDRILDEGCWAGDSAGRAMPRRGVVLSLNRQMDSRNLPEIQ